MELADLVGAGNVEMRIGRLAFYVSGEGVDRESDNRGEGENLTFHFLFLCGGRDLPFEQEYKRTSSIPKEDVFHD